MSRLDFLRQVRIISCVVKEDAFPCNTWIASGKRNWIIARAYSSENTGHFKSIIIAELNLVEWLDLRPKCYR
jgi:hypothetical protein